MATVHSLGSLSSSHPECIPVNPVVHRVTFTSAHDYHEHIIRDFGRDVARYIADRRRRIRCALRCALAAQRGRRGWR
jgi:hypothetical protein